ASGRFAIPKTPPPRGSWRRPASSGRVRCAAGSCCRTARQNRGIATSTPGSAEPAAPCGRSRRLRAGGSGTGGGGGFRGALEPGLEGVVLRLQPHDHQRAAHGFGNLLVVLAV